MMSNASVAQVPTPARVCCTHSLAGRGLDLERKRFEPNLNPNFQTVNQQTPISFGFFPSLPLFICLFQVSVPFSSILFLLGLSVEACISSCLEPALPVPGPAPSSFSLYSCFTHFYPPLSPDRHPHSSPISSSQSPNTLFSPWFTRSLISQRKK